MREKLRITYALFFLLPVLNISLLSAQQRPRPTNNTEHRPRIKVEYDKFKDETRVGLQMKIASGSGDFMLYVTDSNKGKNFEPSGQVGFGFLSDRINWLSDLHSKFYVLTDGERLEFDAEFSEAGRLALIPYLTFIRIIRAKKVEGKIGIMQFELNDEQLEALRELGSQMAVYVDTSRVYKRGEVSQGPRVVSKPEPRYTPDAKRNLISGEVVLRLVLGASGEVNDVQVIKGLPFGLTERAVEAARKIRFKPAIKAGQPVSFSLEVSYSFNPY